MTRLYTNAHFWTRNALLILFLIVVFIYGCWELWRAYHVQSADTSSGMTFGVVFVAGSLFALRQLAQDHRDIVASLDRNDATGDLAAAVWGPLRAETLAGPADRFANWRVQVKALGRRGQAYFIHVDYAGRTRPLRFDLKPGTDLAGLRRLAPEAVAEFAAKAAGKAPPEKAS